MAALRSDHTASTMCPQYLTDIHSWPHLQAFVHVVSKRITGDKTSHSERLYLLSKHHTAQAARHADPWPLADRETACIGPSTS